jgi:hypothetical protein
VLWNENNDLALKRQYKTLLKLYEKYSGRYAVPGAPKFVSPQEFVKMVEDSGVISDHFPFKEIFPIWNLSMMTQVDEINYDRHMNMNFSEFVEATCRVADKLSIPNILEEDYDDETKDNP